MVEAFEIFIVTRDGLSWVPALYKEHRRLRLEPRYFIDDRSSPFYKAIMQRTVLRTMSVTSKANYIEAIIPEVLSYCQGEWIFRVDDDEAFSSDLANWLLSAIPACTKRIIAAPRRAVRFVNGSLVYAQTIPGILEHDYQYRGFLRKGIEFDPRVHTPGILFHSSEVLYAPQNCCLYHFDWIIRTRAERLTKLSGYKKMNSGDIFDRQYLPEDFEDHPYRYTPVTDQGIIKLAQTLRTGKENYDEATSRFRSILNLNGLGKLASGGSVISAEAGGALGQ